MWKPTDMKMKTCNGLHIRAANLLSTVQLRQIWYRYSDDSKYRLIRFRVFVFGLKFSLAAKSAGQSQDKQVHGKKHTLTIRSSAVRLNVHCVQLTLHGYTVDVLGMHYVLMQVAKQPSLLRDWLSGVVVTVIVRRISVERYSSIAISTEIHRLTKRITNHIRYHLDQDEALKRLNRQLHKRLKEGK
uniref:Uncharacterized protein n=1 Tax=Ascaris lumbricoides TaxID=6252 RepID=A0A0M3HRU1_ASCLU